VADGEELMLAVSAETRLPGTGLWAYIDTCDRCRARRHPVHPRAPVAVGQRYPGHFLRSPGNLLLTTCVCVP
jgi:hypothetical protein